MSATQFDTTPVHVRHPATPGRPGITRSSGQSPANLEFDPSVVEKRSVHTLVFRSLKRTHELFLPDDGALPDVDEKAQKLLMSIKARDQHGPVMHLVPDDATSIRAVKGKNHQLSETASTTNSGGNEMALVSVPTEATEYKSIPPASSALAVRNPDSTASAIVPRKGNTMPKPVWHAPWKLMRVVSGHTGWVHSLAVEPGNEWFASGSKDRMVKIWDMASGKLKLSLTGHISGVRGLAVSARQPYLFSCGEDKTVKCWDLEYNKVIRHYHGHLSAVYCMALHPTIDVLITGGRDSCARVWDMRTKAQIHALSGHTNTIATVTAQATEPQVITGSHDTTIRLWDLVAGKARVILTHHKKSVRSIALHPKLNMFASGAPDNIKQWMCPDGKFVQNLEGHNAIVNSVSVNGDGVLVSAADNGTMFLWDWRTGYNFQRTQSCAQPGSIESEAGIFATTFDQSGCRLITAEADKTIKFYKEDEDADEESHPINWKPDIIKRKRY